MRTVQETLTHQVDGVKAKMNAIRRAVKRSPKPFGKTAQTASGSKQHESKWRPASQQDFVSQPSFCFVDL